MQFLKNIGPFKTRWRLGKGRYNDRSGVKRKLYPDAISSNGATRQKIGNKSISQYIQNRYDYKLNYNDLPLIIVSSGNFHNEYYPLEILILYDDNYC